MCDKSLRLSGSKITIELNETKFGLCNFCFYFYKDYLSDRKKKQRLIECLCDVAKERIEKYQKHHDVLLKLKNQDSTITALLCLKQICMNYSLKLPKPIVKIIIFFSEAEKEESHGEEFYSEDHNEEDSY